MLRVRLRMDAASKIRLARAVFSSCASGTGVTNVLLLASGAFLGSFCWGGAVALARVAGGAWVAFRAASCSAARFKICAARARLAVPSPPVPTGSNILLFRGGMVVET